MNRRVLPSYEQALPRPTVVYRSPGRDFYGGIQLPQGEDPGAVFIHNPDSPPTYGHYLFEDIVQATKDGAHLEGLLRKLGVTMMYDEAAGDAYCQYASAKTIVNTIKEINKDLPPEHRLPAFRVIQGSDLPAETMIRCLALDATFTLSTGEGDTPNPRLIQSFPSVVPHAYYSAHDIIVHFSTMVTTEPTEGMGLIQHKALRGLTADPTPDRNGHTPIGRTMRALDSDLTHNRRSIGYSAVDLQPHPDAFQRAFEVDLDVAKRVADLTVAHVAYLTEQFPA